MFDCPVAVHGKALDVLVTVICFVPPDGPIPGYSGVNDTLAPA